MDSSSHPIWIYDWQMGAIKIDGKRYETTKRAALKGSQGSNASEIAGIIEEREKKRKFYGPPEAIRSIGFLADENHLLVVGGIEKKVWFWRVEDGSEVGTPINAGADIACSAISKDNKWVVVGFRDGNVGVWDAKNREKMIEFTAQSRSDYTWVNDLDVSSDATKIATGSDDSDVRVWSLSTGQQLYCFDTRAKSGASTMVLAAKFSPDGYLLAAGAKDSYGPAEAPYVYVHDARNDQLVAKVKMFGESIAWASDSKKLFVISNIGNIHCLDVSSRKTHHSIWPTHGSDSPYCICLAPNGTFIAAGVNLSVSFWDTTTHQQVGPVIHHPSGINSVAISANYDLAVGGNGNVALWNLCKIISSPYIDEEIIQSRVPEASFKESVAHVDEEFVISETDDDETVIQDPEQALKELRTECAESKQKIDSLHKVLHAHHQRHQCETLFSDGHVVDAAKSLLEITKSMSDEFVKADAIITDWLSVFSNKCVRALEGVGDEALLTEKKDEALNAYAIALSLYPTSDFLSTKWATTMLNYKSTSDVLKSINEFKLPIFPALSAICDALLADNRVTEAIERFRQMPAKPALNTNAHDWRVDWELDFKRRCIEKLEKLADVAMSSQHSNEAVELLSAILSLDPSDRVSTLIKRSDSRVMIKAWRGALKDADEVIKLDPSSHLGYERRRAALHSGERYGDAVAAFNTMLSKLEESPDERVRGLRSQYTDARPEIRTVVHKAISQIPQVLIDTTDGRLLDKTKQAEAFEESSIFGELVSSMTAKVDSARIRREVKKFFRYVMLSHKWQGKEPHYNDVKTSAVYNLRETTENTKLRTFCSIVRAFGFRWAWSDTCCIDKSDNVVIQESLVAMFTWYRGSSLTIIYLFGVSSLSNIPGGIQYCIWNTRAWTLQEYIAAEVVQFYTEDWKPYLNLSMWNHKESPSIVSEMERASRFSADKLAALRPGLNSVREKLYMASKRATTRVEDAAYSLLGIFNVSIPIIYGERTRAVGRFLEQIVTGSGDVTVLAWTGTANVYNSCLPLDLSVYDPLVPPHIPHMEITELEQSVTELRASIPDLSLATTLAGLLNKLPSVMLVSSRLRLPCIIFPVTDLVNTSGADEEGMRTYHITTAVLGDVEIKTATELAVECEHFFVHPWIRPLLDQEYARGTAGLDQTTRALRLVARLRQSFGALLLEKVSRVEYKRVAEDSLIMVRVRDEVPLTDLIANIETLEVQ